MALLKVETLDQPQNVTATQCVLLSFPSINKTQRVKRLGAQLMVPLVIMLTFYVTKQHNQF